MKSHWQAQGRIVLKCGMKGFSMIKWFPKHMKYDKIVNDIVYWSQNTSIRILDCSFKRDLEIK